MSDVVRHVAGEIEGRTQKCRRCGAVLSCVSWWRRLLDLPPIDPGRAVAVDTSTGEIVDAPGRRCV